MKVNFEFNFEELDNNELRINGKSSYANKWNTIVINTIVIKKEWISWIITTLRNLTWLDYNSGGKEIVKEYEDCELAIIMFLLEGEYSFIKIFPVWKDEVDIQIIYDSNSKRPKRFLVEYKISNEPTVQMIFNN